MGWGQGGGELLTLPSLPLGTRGSSSTLPSGFHRKVTLSLPQRVRPRLTGGSVCEGTERPGAVFKAAAPPWPQAPDGALHPSVERLPARFAFHPVWNQNQGSVLA